MIIFANQNTLFDKTCHRGLVLKINKVKESHNLGSKKALITYIKRTDCIINATRSDPTSPKQIHPKNQNRKNTSKNSRNYHNKDPRRKAPEMGFLRYFPT
jgi:hypothetical protein